MKKIKKQPAVSSIKRGTKREQAVFYAMLAPFFILFFLFTVLPVITSVILSFFHFDAVSLPTWAGLDNYLRMFVQDDVFPVALRNTH